MPKRKRLSASQKAQIVLEAIREEGYGNALRQKAIKLYIDGAGLRRTGRQPGVHHQFVCLLLQPTTTEKTPVPEILLSQH